MTVARLYQSVGRLYQSVGRLYPFGQSADSTTQSADFRAVGRLTDWAN
jgi:hypothetical protein